MENNKLPDKLIDDYIMNVLDPQDMAAFRKRLELEPALAKEVKLRSEMLSGLEAYGRKELRSTLKDIHQEVVPPVSNNSAKRRSLMPYLIAAASVLLLVVALFWFNSNTTKTTDMLVTEYFEAPALSIAQRDATNESLLSLQQLYSDKNYTAAIPLFKTQIQTSSSSELLLGLGIAYLETGEPAEALTYFNQITQSGDFNFEDEVLWYAALAHLKANDIDAAKKSLQLLVDDPSTDHHEKAVDLLKELR